LVQDLFGQSADQRLALEVTAMVLFRALDDFVDVEGAFGGGEYVMHNCHIRLTSRLRWRTRAGLGAAEGTEGAQLCGRGDFEDIEEFVFGQGIHGERKQVVMDPIYGRSRYMSKQ
jgi:hypothetical protein